jgi:hypothetical protein
MDMARVKAVSGIKRNQLQAVGSIRFGPNHAQAESLCCL